MIKFSVQNNGLDQNFLSQTKIHETENFRLHGKLMTVLLESII